MGNASSARKRVKVDDQYTRPQGLYPDRERDVDAKKLRRLILDGEIITLSLVPEFRLIFSPIMIAVLTTSLCAHKALGWAR